MKKYDTYKDSGIEWIGEIPEHWEIMNLRKKPHNLEVGKREATELKEILSIGGEHIQNGEFDLSNPRYVSNDFYKSSKRGRIEIGDILVVKDGATIGKSMYVEHKPKIKMLLNEHVYKIEGNKYLYYVIASNITQSQFWFHNQSSAQESITINTLKTVQFCWPNPEEQTAIAFYLDQKTAEIDQLIADKENLLELYEEEKTALINDLATGKRIYDGNTWTEPKQVKNSGIDWLGEIPAHWEVKRFKYYFDLINIKTDENLKKIGLENVESKTGRFIETDSDFAGQGVRFQTKDILFGKLRPYLAKVWLAEFDGHAVGDFYVFRAKPSVYPNFAKYRLLDSSFIEITNSSTYGSKMPRVNWEFIANLQIAFPTDIEEQKTIVDFIESESKRLETKIQDTQNLIELLKEYKEALISEVVTGKVKVV